MFKSNEFVTVVSGLPRSGTSLMMQLLKAGGMAVLTDEVRGADANNPLGYYEFEPVKRTHLDASWLTKAKGKAVKMVYRLVYDLPADYAYRVIVMRRDLREVLTSQRKMLVCRGRRADAVCEEEIGQLFRRDLEEFESWLRTQPNFKSLSVSYNELLQNSCRPLAVIDAFLGGGLDTDAMAKGIDRSLYHFRGGRRSLGVDRGGALPDVPRRSHSGAVYHDGRQGSSFYSARKPGRPLRLGQ